MNLKKEASELFATIFVTTKWGPGEKKKDSTLTKQSQNFEGEKLGACPGSWPAGLNESVPEVISISEFSCNIIHKFTSTFQLVEAEFSPFCSQKSQ